MPEPARPFRVLVVGAGWTFTSGISYHTCQLTRELARRGPAAALLVRELVPRRLYPGRSRVGQRVNSLVDYPPDVPVLEGLDWWWGRSVPRALDFLRAQDPDVVVLQWWTGAVLHTYLLLAARARRQGAVVLMEWHEVQDTGEARWTGATRYVRVLMRRLLALVDGHLVHSEHDLALLKDAYGLDGPVEQAPLGPSSSVRSSSVRSSSVRPSSGRPGSVRPSAPPAHGPADEDASDVHVLYFGTIRPYKGVEDLVRAFDLLPDDVASTLRLTIVGETWEGWTAPLDAVRDSPRAHRIRVVNRYVTDQEAEEFFAGADAVALPYHRSSASGPLHMAMSAGLPVLVSDVGGLRAAAGAYEGAVFTRPRDRADIARGLQELVALRGRRFADPHSWSTTLDALTRLQAAATAARTARTLRSAR